MTVRNTSPTSDPRPTIIFRCHSLKTSKTATAPNEPFTTDPSKDITAKDPGESGQNKRGIGENSKETVGRLNHFV
jgi:hypothetical protein